MLSPAQEKTTQGFLCTRVASSIDMRIEVFDDKASLGKAAALQATMAIQQAIAHKGSARIIAATGTSQIEFLAALTRVPGVDWHKVEMFHLDEYIGMPIDRAASFRKYHNVGAGPAKLQFAKNNGLGPVLQNCNSRENLNAKLQNCRTGPEPST